MKIALKRTLIAAFAILNTHSSAHATDAGRIKVTSRPLSAMFHHKYYKIEGKYPLFSGAPAAGVALLNKAVKDKLTEAIPATDGGWSDTPTPKDAPNEEGSDYTLKRCDADYLSMVLTINHLYSGAPHGTSDVHSLNYALKPTVRPLTLKDFVGPKANYRLITKMLRKTLSAPGGTPDQPVDFNVDAKDDKFVFDKTGLTWQWGDYAMGSYVGGARSGYLTFKQLAGAAEPNSLASKLAK